MRQHESGWWIPSLLTAPGNYVRRATDLIGHVVVKHPRVAVQAGGHIGVVPAMLAKHFQHVYTFEPHAENFRCLVRNVPDNVWAARGALGWSNHGVHLREHTKGSGGHSIEQDRSGPVPCYRIDDLCLGCCDAILLDVEGMEIDVLQGAPVTIHQHHPLIVAEENKKCHGQGHAIGDLTAFLAECGYEQTDATGEDLVFRWTR